MHIKHDILAKDEGVVLVMVLIVLVATIIMGIMLSRSSFFEAKIAGNQRTMKNDFYAAEGAGDYIVSEFDSIMSSTGLNLNANYSLTNKLPSSVSSLSDATITIQLTKKNATPPIGSGMGVGSTSCNYYIITTTSNTQSITMGVWKAFAVQQ